jgi:hypothetical protein
MKHLSFIVMVLHLCNSVRSPLTAIRSGFLCQQELMMMEKQWIVMVQESVFVEEWGTLKDGKILT